MPTPPRYDLHGPPGPDEDLRRVLDAWRVGEARPEFREGLLVCFVRDEAVRDEAVPEEQLRGALDAYAPRAHAAFRARLAAEFVGGPATSLEGALESFRPAPARSGFRAELRERFLEAESAEGPARSPRPRPARGFPRRTRRPIGLLLGGGLGAAAAALFLFFLLPTEREGPAPEPAPETASDFVVDAFRFEPEGLTLDGRPVPADLAAEDLAARLEGARSVTTGAGELRFRFRDQFVVELGERTRLELDGLRGDAGPWALANDGSPGEYRVATVEGFDGTRRSLEFHTPARSLRLVGTVFGVDVFDPETVCICCCEGEVETFPGPGGSSELVRARGTLFTAPDGVSRKQDFEAHQRPLRDLREYVKTWP